jgi:hypothetical protein
LAPSVPAGARVRATVPESLALAPSVPVGFRVSATVPLSDALAPSVPAAGRVRGAVPESLATAPSVALLLTASPPTPVSDALAPSVPLAGRVLVAVPLSDATAPSVPLAGRVLAAVPASLATAPSVPKTAIADPIERLTQLTRARPVVRVLVIRRLTLDQSETLAMSAALRGRAAVVRTSVWVRNQVTRTVEPSTNSTRDDATCSPDWKAGKNRRHRPGWLKPGAKGPSKSGQILPSPNLPPYTYESGSRCPRWRS